MIIAIITSLQKFVATLRGGPAINRDLYLATEEGEIITTEEGEVITADLAPEDE